MTQFQGALSKERKEAKIQAQREKDAEQQRGGLTASRILDPMQEGGGSSWKDDDRPSNKRERVSHDHFRFLFH